MKSQNKVVTIDFGIMKAKAFETAKGLGARAKVQKDKALGSLLNKGIELSQKQLSKLEKAKQNLG